MSSELRDNRSAVPTEKLCLSVFEHTPDAVVFAGATGSIIAANNASGIIFGYGTGELAGKPVSSILPDMKITALIEDVKVGAQGRNLIETYGLRRSGDVFPLEITLSTRETEKELFHIFIIRDISERLQKEDLLKESLLLAKSPTRKEYLDSIVKMIKDWSGCRCVGIRILNEEGAMPFESFTGFTEEFWKWENWLSAKNDCCICTRIITGKTEQQDEPITTSHGSFHTDNMRRFLDGLSPVPRTRFRGNCPRFGYLSIAFVPIQYRGRVLGGIHLADEKEGMISDNKVRFMESIAFLAGEALYRLELEASNRDLDRFASIASHDLQEPIISLAGNLKLLERRTRNMAPEVKELISDSFSITSRMQQLVRNLLQYSRIKSAVPERASFEKVETDTVLRSALAALSLLIESSGAQVTHEGLPELKGDQVQLSRLFQNLISNAIKFRRDEPLRVHIRALRKGQDWLFSVRDNGSGISPEYIGKIFDMFFSAPEKTTNFAGQTRISGSGIGLATCKRIVERHGGKIWVESRHGEGSIFYFTIPGRE